MMMELLDARGVQSCGRVDSIVGDPTPLSSARYCGLARLYNLQSTILNIHLLELQVAVEMTTDACALRFDFHVFQPKGQQDGAPGRSITVHGF
jgi:hypothetical protein